MKAAIIAFLLLASSAGAEVRYGSFHAPSLGSDVRYAVDLPASYASGERRYPVVYALHGLFESAAFWERRGLAAILQGLRDRGEVPEFLVVAVDGGNSFFVNAAAGRYEDLVTRDLIEHVEATYQVVPGRGGRALLGVSMGGYAALRIAFSHTAHYRAVAAHSAMLLAKPPTREEGAGRGQMAAFQQVFGDPIDPERWAAADPLAWAAKADPKTAPALYFDCGSEDRYGLAAGNEELHRRLLARGVAHTFALLPGDHGYEYVRAVLERSLRFAGGILREAVASRPEPPQSLERSRSPSHR
jgi:S-formylglutathione hydrolase FrmB